MTSLMLGSRLLGPVSQSVLFSLLCSSRSPAFDVGVVGAVVGAHCAFSSMSGLCASWGEGGLYIMHDV